MIGLTLVAIAAALLWCCANTVNTSSAYVFVRRFTYYGFWVFMALAVLAVALDAWRAYS
jgi:hypothetical protein